MEIWQEIINDRERGARVLVAVYQDRLLAAALMLCHDRAAAEDLLFRTFSRALAKMSTFRPNTNFYNWLYTIMINFRRMDLRKEKVRPSPLRMPCPRLRRKILPSRPSPPRQTTPLSARRWTNYPNRSRKS